MLAKVRASEPFTFAFIMHSRRTQAHRRRSAVRPQWALAAPLLLAIAPVLCSGGSRGMQLVRAGRLEEAFAERARASGAAHDFHKGRCGAGACSVAIKLGERR